VGTISETVTPTVTVSRIGTYYTTVTLSPLPTESITPIITQVPETEVIPVTTIPVAKKSTYSPVSPFTALAAAFIACGFMLAANRRRK